MKGKFLRNALQPPHLRGRKQRKKITVLGFSKIDKAIACLYDTWREDYTIRF